MVEIRKTEAFERWFTSLRDRKAIARISSRIDRLQVGLFGDVKPVEKASRKCVSITDRDIGFISCGEAGKS